MYSSTHFSFRDQMQVSGKSHTPAALPPGKNPGTYSDRGRWVETYCSFRRIEKQYLAHSGIWTSDRPARILISVPTNFRSHWSESRRTEHRIVFVPACALRCVHWLMKVDCGIIRTCAGLKWIEWDMGGRLLTYLLHGAESFLRS